MDDRDLLSGLEIITGSRTKEQQWAELLPPKLTIDNKDLTAWAVKDPTAGLVFRYLCPDFFPEHYPSRGLYVTVLPSDDFPSQDAADAKIEQAMISLRTWIEAEHARFGDA